MPSDALQRKPRLMPASELAMPVTTPTLLTTGSRTWLVPGRVPMSAMPVQRFQMKPRISPSALRETPTTRPPAVMPVVRANSPGALRLPRLVDVLPL